METQAITGWTQQALTVGLRVPEQEEVLGLDTTTHGEVAYQL